MQKGAKRWLITAALLILIGCIGFGVVMILHKWDFTKLSTVKYETNRHVITENYRNISVITNTADITFVITDNVETAVECYEKNTVKHTVSVEDDTLVIAMTDTRKWYEHIEISFGTPKITVYLPQAAYGALSMQTSTGDICVENMQADTMTIRVSTGTVTVNDTNCNGAVSVRVSTGKTALTNVRCTNLLSDGNTGDLSLKNVIATEKFSIERSTGDIILDECDAAELVIKTDTGDVYGTLLSDKVFIAHTDTGRVDVPNSAGGGRCEITTDTGNIRIH